MWSKHSLAHDAVAVEQGGLGVQIGTADPALRSPPLNVELFTHVCKVTSVGPVDEQEERKARCLQQRSHLVSRLEAPQKSLPL